MERLKTKIKKLIKEYKKLKKELEKNILKFDDEETNADKRELERVEDFLKELEQIENRLTKED